MSLHAVTLIHETTRMRPDLTQTAVPDRPLLAQSGRSHKQHIVADKE
jgi:hypothetical protein